jgi:hypothetical protein
VFHLSALKMEVAAIVLDSAHLTQDFS